MIVEILFEELLYHIGFFIEFPLDLDYRVFDVRILVIENLFRTSMNNSIK